MQGYAERPQLPCRSFHLRGQIGTLAGCVCFCLVLNDSSYVHWQMWPRLPLSVLELEGAQVASHAGPQQVPILQRQGQLLPLVQHSLHMRSMSKTGDHCRPS